MKRILIGFTALSLLTLTAAAQTGASASTSGNGGANVQAGQNNASANGNASSNTSATKNGRKAAVNSSDSGSGSAAVNGKSANANSSGGGSGDIAGGTTIPATLTKGVDARHAKPGDEVIAKTTQDVHTADGTTIPKGSRVIGHVTDAKARTKGESESALGIAFDHAVLKNGQQVPFQANIKSLAAASQTASSPLMDDSMAGSGSMAGGVASAPAPRAGGNGGLLGGTTNTVGGVTNGVGSTVNGATNTLGNTAGTVNSTTRGTVNGVAGNTANGSGSLDSTSSGVVGLKGLQLNNATSGVASGAASGATSGVTSSASQGSMITSTTRDVKLDSGTQMVLEVVGSSNPK
jgi:hypothetical protein